MIEFVVAAGIAIAVDAITRRSIARHGVAITRRSSALQDDSIQRAYDIAKSSGSFSATDPETGQKWFFRGLRPEHPGYDKNGIAKKV